MQIDEQAKAMDDLIAGDADLLFDDMAARTEVTDADRELFILLANADGHMAERIMCGEAFTWEVLQIANHRQKAAEYWYRQGKDDGWKLATENEAAQALRDLKASADALAGALGRAQAWGNTDADMDWTLAAYREKFGHG